MYCAKNELYCAGTDKQSETDTDRAEHNRPRPPRPPITQASRQLTFSYLVFSVYSSLYSRRLFSFKILQSYALQIVLAGINL